jgi:hypothetical protein
MNLRKYFPRRWTERILTLGTKNAEVLFLLNNNTITRFLLVVKIKAVDHEGYQELKDFISAK